MVEQPAVNRFVPGSSPGRGATLGRHRPPFSALNVHQPQGVTTRAALGGASLAALTRPLPPLLAISLTGKPARSLPGRLCPWRGPPWAGPCPRRAGRAVG